MPRVEKLSVLIPAYNEQETVCELLRRVLEAELLESTAKELVVVDDGSSDATLERIRTWRQQHPEVELKLLSHNENRGKGAALQTALKAATGDYVVVQDADLEYDPEEYELLLEPIRKGDADVVFGSRFSRGMAHRVHFIWHTLGNKFLTLLSNLATGLNLSDIETCYKLLPREMMVGLQLREERFGFDPEFTAKVSRVPGARIQEVGISYHARTYQQGKKISWRDGLVAIACILKYNLWSTHQKE